MDQIERIGLAFWRSGTKCRDQLLGIHVVQHLATLALLLGLEPRTDLVMVAGPVASIVFVLPRSGSGFDFGTSSQDNGLLKWLVASRN